MIPCGTTATVTRNHAFLVFDTLYGQDDNVRAAAADGRGRTIENDGKLWKLTLRDGLEFHDGKPVLARDASPASSAGASATRSARR